MFSTGTPGFEEQSHEGEQHASVASSGCKAPSFDAIIFRKPGEDRAVVTANAGLRS
jgi:hypothetical protein